MIVETFASERLVETADEHVFDESGDPRKVRLESEQTALANVFTEKLRARSQEFVSLATDAQASFTGPLKEALHHSVVPCGATLSQPGLPAVIQKDVTGRFYFSSTAPFRKAHLSEPFEMTMRRWIRSSLPSIAERDLRVESYWRGRTANLPDGLARICNPAPDVYAPIACNGLGTTTCTQFGIALAAAVTTDCYTQLPVPLGQPRSLLFRGAFNPVLSLLVAGMTGYGRLRGA